MKNNYNLYLILAMVISTGISLINRFVTPLHDAFAFLGGLISLGLLFQYFNVKYCRK
ncbi:MAG: hypothetical protein N4A76_12925 [Firmicutes bacterium]|jgi:hypothetical protein|nr:hypothetical protein [Bacillota bacterium]